MDEVCHDVQVEPQIQLLQGESFDNRSTTTEDDARLDIKANGLWGSKFSRIFFDVKVFNPLAKTTKNIDDPYKYHENLKRLKYEQRIRDVEHSTFMPLIFACTGGTAPSANKVIQRLAEKLSEKRSETYSDTVNYIRTKVSFALIRSAVLCLRGSRKLKQHQIVENSFGAIVEEGKLTA